MVLWSCDESEIGPSKAKNGVPRDASAMRKPAFTNYLKRVCLRLTSIVDAISIYRTGDIHISPDDLSPSPEDDYVGRFVGKVRREGDVVVQGAISGMFGMEIGSESVLWGDSHGRSVLGAFCRMATRPGKRFCGGPEPQ